MRYLSKQSSAVLEEGNGAVLGRVDDAVVQEWGLDSVGGDGDVIVLGEEGCCCVGRGVGLLSAGGRGGR